ncbi:MAG TPA: hypothetical protein H9823_06260 [Candidatus Rubneribacter avistercoris]|nr:hypothetical protein [Candidatus Rubneribacter avistercoris]
MRARPVLRLPGWPQAFYEHASGSSRYPMPQTHKCDLCVDRQARGELPACVAACPGMNIAADEMDALQSAHQADIVSDEASGTKPNFVITVDPLLAAQPDDTAAAARAAKE